jgi:Mrp family chromosome partitioning ATPase
MLRTQVLQSMGVGGWKILGVTSPTPGCGKTLTAINLAFSTARQSDQPVVLVDLDLQKPQIAKSLGLTLSPEGGVLDLLEERTILQRAAVTVRAGKQRLVVFPTDATKTSSELMSSRAMRNLLQDLRKTYPSHIIILDLPPILSSDDVIAVLPQIDCVLLVAAVGHSKVSEVEECNRHLQSTHLVRLVVNKAADANYNYYYY